MARESFIQCESDRVFEKRLFRREWYSRPKQINPGDWIYFKKQVKKVGGTSEGDDDEREAALLRQSWKSAYHQHRPRRVNLRLVKRRWWTRSVAVSI